MENVKYNTDTQKGHKHKKENYHQVSLKSIVCKVAEKIVRSRVTAFWSEYQVINLHQLGYLKGKSTLAHVTSQLFSRLVLIKEQLKNNRCRFFGPLKSI